MADLNLFPTIITIPADTGLSKDIERIEKKSQRCFDLEIPRSHLFEIMAELNTIKDKKCLTESDFDNAKITIRIHYNNV